MGRPTACCSTIRTPTIWPPSTRPIAPSTPPPPKIRPMLDLAPLLVSALILGLLGGGHCLGMCGCTMGALTLAIPKEQHSRRFRLLLAYNLGRILSYATAGLLIGLAGWAVANSPAAMFMRVLAGLLLISMGLYLASAAGDRAGRRTRHGTIAQAQCTHGRRRAGDAVRDLDLARPPSALANGPLKGHVA